MKELKVLFIGDIIGKLGRTTCVKVLPDLKKQLAPDLIIANGENSAHGYGITEKIYKELLDMGIEAITMGNHMWDKKEIVTKIENMPLVIRPANYPPDTPGQDHLIIDKGSVTIGLVNLCGRTFMQPLDCPFQAVDKLLPKIKSKIIIVDIHAEATSEKVAMSWYLDGKVSAVLGTHTHVMTADERILPQGTAMLSDIGMVGAYDSIIGMNKEQILKRFTTQLPEKFAPTETGPGLFNAVLLKIDTATGKTKKIERIVKLVESSAS